LVDLAEELILLGTKLYQETEISRAAHKSPQSVLSPIAIPKDITYKIPEVSSSNILPKSHHTSEDTRPTANCTLHSTETSTMPVVQSQVQSDLLTDPKASELHCLKETFSIVITIFYHIIIIDIENTGDHTPVAWDITLLTNNEVDLSSCTTQILGLGTVCEAGDVERQMNGIARVFHGDYIAPSGRNGAQINMKHFYEGELRGKDMEGFGRLMYDSELFVGYMAVEHYDHNSQIDKKALGGHGAFMRA
jgi:hypothetical protein